MLHWCNFLPISVVQKLLFNASLDFGVYALNILQMPLFSSVFHCIGSGGDGVHFPRSNPHSAVLCIGS